MAVNQIKAGAALSYFSLLFGNLIVLLYTPFMLKMMGQSEYGIYSICNTISSTIAMLDSGLGIAAVKYITQNKGSKKLPSIVGAFLIFYSILGICAFILSGIAAESADVIFRDSMSASEIDSVRVILWITGVYLLVSFLTSAFSAIVVAYERFVFIKAVDIIKTCLLPLLIIPFLLNGYKAIAMSTITVCVFLVVNVVKLLYSVIKLDTKVSFKGIEIPFVKEAIPFAVIIFIKLLLDRIYWSGGHFILGIVAGTIPTAIFAIALQMRGYYFAIANSVNNLFLPRCSELAMQSDNICAVSSLFNKVSRVQIIILGVVICGYYLFGQEFMNLWAGKEYASAFWASFIIMVPYTIPMAQGIGNSVLQAYGKLKFQAIVYSIIATIVIFGSFILGKKFDVMGCAYAIAFCIVAFEIIVMNFYYYRLGINIKAFWRDFITLMLPYMCITALFKLLFHFIKVEGWLSLAVWICAFTTIAIIIEYITVFNLEEKGMVVAALRRLRINDR